MFTLARTNWNPTAPRQSNNPKQQAAPPQQQAQDHTGNVIFIPPVATTQQTATLMPGLISTVDTGLTSTSVDRDITSIITSSHHPTLELMNCITVPIGYHVNQTIKQKHHNRGICQPGNFIGKGPHSCPCNTYSYN